jgi:hypothetical protein
MLLMCVKSENLAGHSIPFNDSYEDKNPIYIQAV